MKVTLSSRARHDLEGIRNYIEQDNPVRAISFVNELRDIMKRLANMPRAFPLVPRYEHHGIRRRSYKRYGILYSVEPHLHPPDHRSGAGSRRSFATELRAGIGYAGRLSLRDCDNRLIVSQTLADCGLASLG